MPVIEASVVDSVNADVSSIKPARIPQEMARASRGQPDLLAFILGATEGMSPGVSELAGYIYFVIWRVFHGENRGRMKPVTARAIQRKLEENEKSLSQFDGTDPQTIDAPLIARLTGQPAVFAFMIEAIVAAEEDEMEPVVMSPEEKGALILLLKTAIDTLDDACGEAA